MYMYVQGDIAPVCVGASNNADATEELEATLDDYLQDFSQFLNPYFFTKLLPGITQKVLVEVLSDLVKEVREGERERERELYTTLVSFRVDSLTLLVLQMCKLQLGRSSSLEHTH